MVDSFPPVNKVFFQLSILFYGYNKIGTDEGRTRDLWFTRPTPYHWATGPTGNYNSLYTLCLLTPLIYLCIYNKRMGDNFPSLIYFPQSTIPFLRSKEN